MPALFQAVSRSVLHPTLKKRPNIFREWTWSSSREQEAFLRLNTDKSKTPQLGTRLLGGVDPGVRSQGLPKELRFREPTNKHSRTLPRVIVKYLPGWTGAQPSALKHYYFVSSNSIKTQSQVVPEEKGKLLVNRKRVREKNKAEIIGKTPKKKVQIPQRISANPDKKLHERELPEMHSSAPKSAPRYIRDSIDLASRTFRQEPSSFSEPEPGLEQGQKDEKKPNTHNSGSAFKLGTQLKVHDYGFKKIKQRQPKDSGKRDSNKSPPSKASLSPGYVSDACSQRTFRSFSFSERSSARQTASDMFVRISRSYEERIASKADLLAQQSRLEKEKPQEIESKIDLTEENVSLVDPGSSEKLKRTTPIISGETKAQSMENKSSEIQTTFNLPQMTIPSDAKESQPSEILKKKIYRIPRTDVGTQTICACGICQFLNKSKAEKPPPPLVVEMENNRKMLEQRNYYMENLRPATMKFNEEADKSPHSALPISSDYSKHRNHCIYDANRKDKVHYLRGSKNISECYRDPIAVRPWETNNHKTHRFADYRAPNVSNIFARCYHTLFEAEQRTNGILFSDFNI